MKRSLRAFCATVFEREERALQTKVTLTVPPPPPVQGSNIGWPVFTPTSWLATTHVPLKSAKSNAATNTVTLIPRQRLTYRGGLSVNQGHPAGGSNAGTGAAHGLVDLEGHALDQTTTSGKLGINVNKGYTIDVGYWDS